MAPRHYGLQAHRSSKPSLLLKYRASYPFRLIREHSLEPRPERLNPDDFGNFARVPALTGDEWFFELREGLELFLSRYGGTELPKVSGETSPKENPARFSMGLAGAASAAAQRSLSPISLPNIDLSGLERSGELLSQRLRERKR